MHIYRSTPDTKALERLKSLCAGNGITQGRSMIGDEKEGNVFMRLDSPTVRCELVNSGF